MRRVIQVALVVGIALLVPALCTAADEISVSASVDMPTVGLDDQFTYTITVDGAARGVEVAPLPRMEGLSVLSGPSVGQQSSFSMTGGGIEQKSVLTHTYRLLPEKVGTFTIPSVTVNWEGRTYQTGDVTVTVVEESQRPPASRTPFSPFDRRSGGQRSRNTQPQRQVFLRAETPKAQVYQGEALPLAFRVYTQYDVGQFGFRKDPRFEGFWVEKVDEQPQMKNTTVDGEEFGVFTAYRYVLYPTAPGRYTIGEQTLGINVITADRFSFFDRQQQIFRRSDPLEVEVLPLPPGAPEGFGGAVGEYQFRAELSDGEAATGDALTLRLTVSGTGNLRGLGSPELPPLPDFRVYEPETRDDLRLTAGGIRGSRTWEYVIVPRAPGRQTVPPIGFTWFSPAAGAYREASSEPLVLEVTRGESFTEPGPGGGDTGEAAVSRMDVELVEEDIAFIRAVPETLEDQAAHAHRAAWFLALLLLPLLVNLAALVTVQVRRRSPAAVAAQRRRRALRAAQGRIAAAVKAARSGDALAFSSGLDEALKRYVADKFGLPGTAGLTIDGIRRRLLENGVADEPVAQLAAIIEDCDFIRFAPAEAGTADELGALADRARALLKSLEPKL